MSVTTISDATAAGFLAAIQALMVTNTIDNVFMCSHGGNIVALVFYSALH